MKKVTIIGAGSTMFTRQLLSSLYYYPELATLQVVLEDVDPAALKRSLALSHKMLEQEGLNTDLISATTNQKDAVKGADFVINCIQVGGIEPWKLDVGIPKKYGVDQEVGDTLGPGGVFRALRHIPQVLSILRDMEELCPNALFINYANPLAPLTWAANRASSIKSIGLCYGVTYTVAQLAGYLGFGPWVEHPHTAEDWEKLMYSPIPEKIDVLFGGINHMTWILKLLVDGEDQTEEIERVLSCTKTLEADGVRCEIYKHFGYWSTENHWHFTDYVPYFRKSEEMINKYLPKRWNLLKLAEKIHLRDEKIVAEQLAGKRKIRVEKTVLNAPKIIHSMCTGVLRKINGNVANNNLISNLPADCVVEVPIFVNKTGLQPTRVGSLPTQCAALNQTNINVQRLVVEAALNHDKNAAFHAVCLDPLTSAICSLDQIKMMFDELWDAQTSWLDK